MKKFSILFAMLIATIAVKADYKVIVADDPSNDAMGGIDIKALSYEISADKKNITFKAEMHNPTVYPQLTGFLIYTDEDLDPSAGDSLSGKNKSMKADRTVTIINLGSSWGTSLRVKGGQAVDIGSVTKILVLDNKTITISLPLDKIDGDGDGKFNLVFTSAKATSNGFLTDDVPNTNYLKVEALGSATGIMALNTSSIKVYPNPAANMVTFSLKEAVSGGNITLFDISGREVNRLEFNGSSATVSVQELQSGIYNFRLTGNDGAILGNGRVVVQH